ncbi:hypothetical protein KFK09_025657 [Dendrobium nobile]|uniref:ubiquitinyl hydrolase 1 n=1 Tax=Dendrobium nobile TaxID=94219 RepID=A0A8T3A4F1_DENNO|nr:hypothetical protein KFK09_025657 [Dendrobium nobile]
MPLDVVVVGSRWWPMMMITAKPASEIDLKSLVQDKEPLLNLEQDVTSHRVLKKIKELHEKYASFRRVRGDGNCFFRAFKFAYLVIYDLVFLALWCFFLRGVWIFI